ncbi:MAG: hypothetical protein D4S02_15410 [Rhodocyclaceae bacterium]|nr:MAG: hypothetical protein D4S02_15410 [Rhodocyclaceae bacterium]
MSTKQEKLTTANAAHGALLQQQQRVAERVEQLSKESTLCLQQLHAAATEARRMVELQIRGIASDAELAAARAREQELREKYAATQEQIEVARGAGKNMLVEFNLARTSMIRALDDLCGETIGSLGEVIRGDAKLRQKLLEIHAAILHSSEGRVTDRHDIQWRDMLVTVFVPPQDSEHFAAIEAFRKKYSIPNGLAVAARDL